MGRLLPNVWSWACETVPYKNSCCDQDWVRPKNIENAASVFELAFNSLILILKIKKEDFQFLLEYVLMNFFEPLSSVNNAHSIFHRILCKTAEFNNYATF